MSARLPLKMKAITIDGSIAKVSEIPLPKLRPTYVLCKVDSIALNPTDWKHINGKQAAPNGLAGCDFSGTVVQVGPEVTKSLKPGDRIAGATHGANTSQPEDGCFSEYCVAKGDLLVRLPDSLSFEAAATFPLGVSTVGQGLFQKGLKLDLPTEPSRSGETVLIYGGSSATGSLAIQFAKLAGYQVLTTCSPQNTSFVTMLGADGVYNYKEKGIGQSINRDSNNSLKLIWDTISVEDSAEICSEALSTQSEGSKYWTIFPIKLPDRNGVDQGSTLMYTIFNEAFTKAGRDTPASQEDFDFAKKIFEITENLLAEDKLRTHPERVGPNGLEGALQGMEDMKNGKVSRSKLVYRVNETPAASTAKMSL